MDVLDLVNDNNHVGPGHDIHLRPFVCTFQHCDRAFARKSDLARHFRIHTNDRPYICSVRGCGKAFIQRSALTVHTRVHTGERPHHCETCDKAFADSSSLARHRRIHTGKRPYGCKVPDCGRSFARRNTYLKHFKRQHPELPPPSSAHVRAIHIPNFRMGGPHPFLPGMSTEMDQARMGSPVGGQYYLSSPGTISTPSGVAASHPSEHAAYTYGGFIHSPQFVVSATSTGHGNNNGNQLLVPSHPVRPYLQPIIVHPPTQDVTPTVVTNHEQAHTPHPTIHSDPGTAPVSAAVGTLEQQQADLHPPTSAVSDATSAQLGQPQYTSSGVFAYSDNSVARVQANVMYYDKEAPQAAWPVWGGGVGGGFAPSQIALPPTHVQAAYYQSTPGMTRLTSTKAEPLSSPMPQGDHEMSPEPLVEITNVPSIKFQPAVDAPPLPLTAVNTQHHFVPDFATSTRLHSAPPHLQRFHSLPAVPTLSNEWSEIDPYHGPGGYGDAHSIGGGRSGEDEEWEQLEEEMLSRDASEGVEEKEQEPAAIATGTEVPTSGDGWSAVTVNQQPRYPSSASTASTTSTFANLTHTPLTSNLPPISVFAYSAPPNQPFFYPSPITPAQMPNTALPAHSWAVKPTAMDSQVVLGRNYFPQGAAGPGMVPFSPMAPDHAGHGVDIHDITLITPPQLRRDAVATVGLGIANVHFDERGDEAIVVAKWGEEEEEGKGKKGKKGKKVVKVEQTEGEQEEEEEDEDEDGDDDDEMDADNDGDEFVPTGKKVKRKAGVKRKASGGRRRTSSTAVAAATGKGKRK